MIELLLVDDHTIFRSGLRRLLMDEPDIRVAEEASNGNDDQRKNRQYLSHSDSSPPRNIKHRRTGDLRRQSWVDSMHPCGTGPVARLKNSAPTRAL